MGYSLWLYPKEVYRGFIKGGCYSGIIDLKISKSDIMKMPLERLNQISLKDQNKEAKYVSLFKFLFWILVSQFVFLFPLIMLVLFTIGYIEQ